MMSLYAWLKFLHLVGLALFLFGHGMTGGTSFALRARPDAMVSRALLRLSVQSNAIAVPGLLLVLLTGVWMGFLGGWWRSAWIWTAIGALVVLMAAMSAVSAPYHRARQAKDDAVLVERLSQTRPELASWIGAAGLLALIFLMVFKPF